MSSYHVPVLLSQVVDGLHIERGKYYIDATFGGGGHSSEIVKRGGRVLGIDADQDAIVHAKQTYTNELAQGTLKITRGNFSLIDEIAKEQGIKTVAGILFDLGISSHQVDTSQRGFSFQHEGPLDMRMDQGLGVQASDLLNVLTKKELAELFFSYGEESFGQKIAQAIVTRRAEKRFTTTGELVETIESVVPKRFGQMHPATKVFQALRIAVNDELRRIEDALPKAFSLLENQGRLVVISFHSLEDRIVKHSFQEIERSKKARIVTKNPITPTMDEVERNPRSRSAKLRIIERIV